MSSVDSGVDKSLVESLDSVRQLTRFAWLSIFMMLFGSMIVVGSFAYSVTRLRPLEKQVSERQAQVQELETQAQTTKQERDKAQQERDKLNAEISELERQRAELEQIKNTSEASAGANKLRA